MFDSKDKIIADLLADIEPEKSADYKERLRKLSWWEDQAVFVERHGAARLSKLCADVKARGLAEELSRLDRPYTAAMQRLHGNEA